jgi:uncharacterized membrane protein
MTDATGGRLARYRRPLRYVMGGLYVLAGVLHFVNPKMYERIVPPSLPRPRELVYLSGVAEVVLGLGVLIERTRERSARGIVLLLLAVFPANVHMATSDDDFGGIPDWLLWARLPLQGVLALWAWWYTRPTPDAD